MHPIQEKIKNTSEDVFNRLKALESKKKSSPDLPPPPISTKQRSKWSHLQPAQCESCKSYISIIEALKKEMMTHSELLESLASNYRNLENRLSASEEIRKLLTQKLQEKKGPMRVCCRVKPALSTYIEYPDLASEKSQIIQISKLGAKNLYFFDRIFNENCSQNDVFEEVQSYIQTAVDGGKVCIFSYGQTGSGKTFTLEGKDLKPYVNEYSGILPRSAEFIFAEMSRQGLVRSQVYISCAEVYMDQISDLLSDNRNMQRGLDDISWKPVETLADLLMYICEASHKRITRETHLNASSSRSHTIYQIRIEGALNGKEIKGKISVIDLAGSERASTETFANKTSEEIENMKKVLEEGKFINKSLSCLKRVFMALAGKSGAVVPYRESKLTKVLQDQLQAGVVILFVTVSPDSYLESLESLKFGSNVQEAKV